MQPIPIRHKNSQASEDYIMATIVHLWLLQLWLQLVAAAGANLLFPNPFPIWVLSCSKSANVASIAELLLQKSSYLLGKADKSMV